MRSRVFVLTAVLLLLSIPAAAQVGEVKCSVCESANTSTNSFCTSCGARLEGSSVRIEREGSTVFISPANLLSVPTARVVPQSYIGVTLGNSFGFRETGTFLGSVGVGLGDAGELQVSTASFVSSVFSGAMKTSTWFIKFKLLSEAHGWPGFALSIRGSNDWDNSNSGAEAISTSNEQLYREGLRGLDYESRLTIASLSSSAEVLDGLSLHAVASVADIRYRNVGSYFVSGLSEFSVGLERKQQIHAAAGAEWRMDERTEVIGELQTVPLFGYQIAGRSLVVNRMYVGALAIRFSLSRHFSLDGGIRYQSNFTGLADVQFRVGVNGMFTLE